MLIMEKRDKREEGKDRWNIDHIWYFSFLVEYRHVNETKSIYLICLIRPLNRKMS